MPISLTGSDAASAVRHVLPDVGVLAVGLLTWRLSLRWSPEARSQVAALSHKRTHARIETKRPLSHLLSFLDEISCVLLCNPVGHL